MEIAAEGLEITPVVVVRFPRHTFGVLKRHLRTDPRREAFAFALAQPIVTPARTVLLVQELLLPDVDDYAVRTAGRVAPTSEFQALAYFVAKQRGLALLDVHTHVSSGAPALSAVDHGYAARNARYMLRRLGVPFAAVVANRRVDALAGVFFDREQGVGQRVDGFQVIGPYSRDYVRREAASGPPDPCWARQCLVPGLNQALLAAVRIGIVGLGGNGARVFELLAGMGVAERGGVVLVDPDRVEASNLPRLPYAALDDVGRPKVDVAARFLHWKNPRALCDVFRCSVADAAAKTALSGCDVLLACGDSDGVRLLVNDLAVRCGMPLIDLGADIQVRPDGVEAGGQVRVVVPGTTACLACCRAFDPGQAALDLLGDLDRATYAQRGYVLGADIGPTPSVAVLNSLVAGYAVTALLALLNARPFPSYLYVDWLTGRVTVARAVRQSTCPACGESGVVFAGVQAAAAPPVLEPSWQWICNTSGRVARSSGAKEL